MRIFSRGAAVGLAMIALAAGCASLDAVPPTTVPGPDLFERLTTDTPAPAVDVVEVWVCAVPLTTTEPLYGDMTLRLDLEPEQIARIAQALQAHGMDAVIATNTTISRDAVAGEVNAGQTGGLSGAPVFEMSNRVIRMLREHLPRAFPIIGVGGILSGRDARAKIDAGADLVQIYTGLIYQGPRLIGDCARTLAA